MSQENVDLVVAANEAFVAGRPRFDLLAPDFEWDFTTAPGVWPEKQIYRGKDEAIKFLQAWVAAFDDWTMDVEEVIDAGDRVVMVGLNRGKIGGSTTPIEARWTYVTTVRDGLMTRTEVYSTRDEAIAAVGLSD